MIDGKQNIQKGTKTSYWRRPFISSHIFTHAFGPKKADQTQIGAHLKQSHSTPKCSVLNKEHYLI